MKEPYGEGRTSHPDPESCAVARKGASEALTGAHAGQVFSREITFSGRRRRGLERKAIQGTATCQRCPGPARSQTLCMRGTSMRENREISGFPVANGWTGGRKHGKGRRTERS